MSKKENAPERPDELHFELCDVTVREYIKEMFVPDIKNDYYVEYLVQLPNGKWAVKLVKSLLPKLRDANGKNG